MAVDEPNKSEEIHVAAASAHKVTEAPTEAPTPTEEDVSLALILPLLNGFYRIFDPPALSSQEDSLYRYKAGASAEERDRPEFLLSSSISICNRTTRCPIWK